MIDKKSPAKVQQVIGNLQIEAERPIVQQPGGKDFYIDLLFYQVKLHAFVVVELKTREFEPADACQLNLYINLVNDKCKTGNDNDTIGLLLCKGKSKVLAEYALKSIKQPVGVSDYELSKAVRMNLRRNFRKSMSWRMS